MTCCKCKEEYSKDHMYGKGKRYCLKCFTEQSEFIKGRKVALNGLKSMSLDAKVIKTRNLVNEAIDEFGLTGVYISYSGGKDSTVLSHIIRQDYPAITHIFSNTTNEYPETLKHIKWETNNNDMNLIIAHPRDRFGKAFNFKRVVEEYGFPMFTKSVSNAIRTYRRAKTDRTKENSQNYIDRMFTKYDCYKNLNISDQCCDKLKKAPIKKLAKSLDLECSIIGTMTEESRIRETDWYKNGCNIFYKKKDNQCRPMSFWNETDIYEYIKKYDVKISDLYSKGYSRNGCMFCGFGVEYESKIGLNRYEKLSTTHPKMYKYLKENFGELLDQCKIRY